MKLYVEPGGEGHIPLAKRLAGNIERLRIRLNLPVMAQRMSPDTDTSITVQSTPLSLLVRIHRLPAGNMLFCKRDGGNALVFAYDYITKVLTPLGAIPVGDGPLELLPFHDTDSHLVSPLTSNGYDTSVHTGPDITFEGEESPTLLAFRIDKTNGREYAVAMDGQTPVLYARTPGNPFRKAAIFPSRTAPEGQTFKWAIQDGDDPRVFQISGGIVYLAGFWEGDDLWNLFNGYEFFGYNPAGESTLIYQWFSELGFASGALFGSNGISWNITNGPFKNPIVEFGTLLDDRFGSDGRGHCEMLLSADYVDGVEGPDLSLTARFVNVNTSDTIPPVVINFSEHLNAADTFEYHYWSTGTPESAEDRAASGRWAALIAGSSGKWVLHDYPGFSRQTLGGEGYNFHTVSNGGNFVFVAGTTAGVEQGLMLDTLTGEVTQHPLITGFESGCYIPAPSPSANKITLLGTIADLDTVTKDPPQGAVRPRNTSQGVQGNGTNWKVVTDTPFTARGLLWTDQCWEWSADEVVSDSGDGFVIIDGVTYPLNEAPFRIGATPDAHTLFGTFKYDPDTEITVEPVGIEGGGGGVDLITTFQHPGVSLNTSPLGFPDNTFECVFCTIPVNWEGPNLFDPGHLQVTGQKIPPEGVFATVDLEGVDDCTYGVSAEDSCGRSDDVGDVPIPQPPLFLTGTDAPIVGSIYVGSGGKPPYRYTFDSGSIDEQTGEILSITDCADLGNIAMGAVSVSDVCDQGANLNVRLPSGHWEFKSVDGPQVICGGGNATPLATHIVGSTKIEIRYCGTQTTGQTCGCPLACALEGFPCCLNCSFHDIDDFFTDTTIFERIFLNIESTFEWEC